MKKILILSRSCQCMYGLEFHHRFHHRHGRKPFPSYLSMNDPGFEERRLFYVAINRAKRQLVILYAGMRYQFGQPATTILPGFQKRSIQSMWIAQ